MSDDIEIQKRLTLNWLIQGAAQHAGMTFHHVVRDELNAVDSRLLRLYDQYALINLLQYWHRDSILFLGWPPRFWRRAGSNLNHPFFGHALLCKHGGTLAEVGRQRALERCKEKGLSRFPGAFSFQVLRVVTRLRVLEARHRPRLVILAKAAASKVWDIPSERLDGELTDRIVLRRGLIPTHSLRGAMLSGFITGYGCVVKRGAELVVVAKGTNWQLLAKELVKGTAELVCLHGLSHLSDETYQRVIDATDQLELEPWMLQSGGELWRRLLVAVPDDRPLARVLMHLARLPARDLESIVAAIIEQPELAQNRLAALGRPTT